MRFAKLISTLQSLQPPEQEQLLLYVQSPYFNTSQAATQLYLYLIKTEGQYTEQNLSVKAMARQSTLIATAAQQTQAATRLRKLITGFVAQQQWQQNKFEQPLQYLKAFKQHHLFRDFEEVYAQTEKQLHRHPEQDADVFYYLHRLEEIKYNGYNAKLQRNRKNDISPVLQSLDTFYALHKLRYCCEAVHRQQWFGIENTHRETQHLLQILQPLTNTKHPYVYLFVHVYQMLTATQPQQAEKHYRLIQQYTQRLGKRAWSQAVTEAASYTTNFCLKQFNTGNRAYGIEYLWWIEQMFARKLLLSNKKIQPVLFRNVLSMYVSLQRPAQQVRQFIDTWHTALPTENETANLGFAEGMYYYAAKNFTEAGACFTGCEIPNDPLHNCVAKRWNFMCQYESRKSKAGLDVLLATYEKYILRHKHDLHQFKPAFNLFISYSKKLLKQMPDKKLRQQIQLQLENEKHFAGKDWLLAQWRK